MATAHYLAVSNPLSEYLHRYIVPARSIDTFSRPLNLVAARFFLLLSYRLPMFVADSRTSASFDPLSTPRSHRVTILRPRPARIASRPPHPQRPRPVCIASRSSPSVALGRSGGVKVKTQVSALAPTFRWPSSPDICDSCVVSLAEEMADSAGNLPDANAMTYQLAAPGD